eukprot:scaffold2928_cov23-Tisochrysis_lutea.AAC.3
MHSWSSHTHAHAGPVLFVFLVAILAIVIAIRRPGWHDHRNLFGVVLPPKRKPPMFCGMLRCNACACIWDGSLLFQDTAWPALARISMHRCADQYALTQVNMHMHKCADQRAHAQAGPQTTLLLT